ncbi:MAG: hypothetical protein E7614_04665 [Ruminococcaceae bacterium]|nr:hypothetical protein [Oscillospiraceae bacterium]
MKKLFSIALSILMLLSCFAFSVSAEGVNVFAADKGATYSYMEDMTEYWYGSCKDENAELLNNGVVPEMEEPFETVGIQGTNRVVTIVIDLGALYKDITSINFLCVCDSYTDKTSGANRSFSGKKTNFRFSEDGDTFTRNKDFEMERVKMDPDSAESYYNFNFAFKNVTARYIELTFYSPVYILSLGEIEVISASGVGTTVEEPSSEEESSEDISVESEEEPSEDVSVEPESTEAPASSDAESTDASTEESKIEASKEESKTEASTENSSQANGGDNEGIDPVVIIVIIVAVVAVAAVVVIVVKKKK